jgi:hypothetical protein
MRKAIIFYTVFASACVLLTGCMPDSRVSQDKVASYVNDNYELLETITSKTDEEIRALYITSILGNKTIVRSISVSNKNIVEFFCGGRGMLNNNVTYTGFFFSKDDTPSYSEWLGFYVDNATITEPGIYEWENQRHRAMAVRIRANWFYYMEHWK